MKCNILYLSILVMSSHLFAQVPPGMKKVDHYPKHVGQDLKVVPGQKIVSPINGKVVSHLKDEIYKTNWNGIVIKGVGIDRKYTIRLIGVKSSIKVGSTVKKSSVLGSALDAGKIYKGVLPYVHIEVYENKKLINPEKLLKIWGKYKPINAGENYQTNIWKLMQQVDGGFFDTFVAKNNIYKKVIATPTWETFDFEPFERYADFLAKNKKFKQAVKMQEIVVKFLELEYKCALGQLPDPQYGINASCRSKTSVGILLPKMQANLEAYKANKQSIFLY